MSPEALQQRYDQLRFEAEQLTGGLADLSRRATVYRHLFLTSGGNHAFPLIAAHGALWAGGYFRFGMRLGSALAWQYLGQPELRRRQLQKLADFADVFRDINRRVCIDTYVNYHFTRQLGRNREADRFIPADLQEALQRLHAATKVGRTLSDMEQQRIFEAHFRHEQRYVVSPTLTEAVIKFEWPLIRAIALKPLVRFAYFPVGMRLWFRDFSSQEERIEQGLRAFEIAAHAGWSRVDAALERYAILPAEYFATPAAYFQQFRIGILSPA